MTIAAFNNLGLGVPNSSTIKSNSEGDDLQNEFLTLMVAQIQNQDPLEPMDGAEYVSQLAEFTQVDSAEKLNAITQNNSALLGTLQTLTIAGLVGDQVWVSANHINPSNESKKVQIDMPTASASVDILLTDDSGAQRIISIGPQRSGIHQFELSGDDLKWATGNISVTSEAGRMAVAGAVSSVSIPSDGSAPTLDVEGVGVVPFYNISKFGQ